MKTLLLILIFCVAVPWAGLLDGYYQITSLVIYEDGGQTRGFNNTDLYVYADERQVSVAGAFRGFPFRQSAAVERVVRDTLVLRDAEDRVSIYKFHIRNNVVTGRHALRYDDGTRRVINSRAIIRKLNQGEVERVRGVISFGSN